MFCSSCGREICDNAQFCKFCGAATSCGTVSDVSVSDAWASGRVDGNCPTRFQYTVTVIIGWVINLLAIWIDNLAMVGIMERHGYYYDGYGFSFSRGPYVFLHLIGFVALGGGIFLLRGKNGDKAHSVGKAILGIVLGIILTGECIILFMHHVILGAVFLVSLALSLLLGFCVHSIKPWVHIVYYAAALFLYLGCTMFIHLGCIKGVVSYLYSADSVAVIVPFTILLPLISFGRGRYCPALHSRNVHSGAEQPDSAYRLKQPAVQADRPGSPEDASSFGYAMLGFFVPIVGLVLWLVWRDTLPLRAKSAGKGALTAVLLNVVVVVIYVLYVVAVVMQFTF